VCARAFSGSSGSTTTPETWLEHCGMLDNKEYSKCWETKLKWYRAGGVLPIEEGGGRTAT
jgi:hypothetical protein